MPKTHQLRGIDLYPHQERFLSDIRASLSTPRDDGDGNRRRVIAQAPTGMGKTVSAARMIQLSQQKGYPVMFLVHGRQLVFQASATFARYGIQHGVVMAAASARDARAGVQVASVDTLASWVRNDRSHQLPPAAMILVDEAHESTSPRWRSVLGQYPQAVVVGLTATPAKGDGSGLGDVYEDIVMGPSVQWLTEHGYLVPAEYYSIDVPDLSGIQVQAGEYVQTQLDDLMAQKALVGDVVETWRKHASGKATIVFATGVRHSKFLAEAFNAAGISAFHIDANTPQETRNAAFEAIRAGDLKVLTNCRVLNRGFDCPPIEVCIDAAPTRSFVMHIQKLGRVLRTYEGKESCLILDHAGNLLRHGPVTREFTWSLDSTDDAQAQAARERLEDLEREMVCPQCGYIFTGRSRCLACGWEVPQAESTPKNVETIKGELRRMTPEYWEALQAERDAERGQRLSREREQEWFDMLTSVGYERGYRRGWAANVFKSRFGVWPNAYKRHSRARQPDAEVLEYINHRARRSN